ncbi:MAG: FdtA/QdtA family cupin domain-containing protein [Bacteroides sp.]|nr:FdtA/QdtA family cupin domain-containing protein [Prevotella sp.]MCM1407861.1 FdtA/QdtA family cupin domain-containing protein [Treponema brennaborense]MCM1469603.1 FdtA/QdtA family cupin domain-containing protein [Bacteroides sp.]
MPFSIKRVYYIYNVPPESVRGGHRHKKNTQALVCVSGSCRINIDDGLEKSSVVLDSPTKCLVLHPKDWHTMGSFSSDAVLLVLASEYYDASDYIDEPYSSETSSKKEKSK